MAQGVGARRFALQQIDLASQRNPEWPTAVITAVGPGLASDGNALVTVTYLGTSLNLPYLASYTPAAGDVVVLARSGGNWLIVDRVIGNP